MHTIMWINLIDIFWLNEAKNKKIHTVWFHLHEPKLSKSKSGWQKKVQGEACLDYRNVLYLDNGIG